MSVWRPRTTSILIGGMVVVVIAAAVAFIITNFQPKTDLRLGSGAFSARVAADEASRTLGLSNIASLKPNDALIMVYDTVDNWGITMRDMKVSIDILWLSDSKDVLYIVKNADPATSEDKIFKPQVNARYVIELSAGAIQQNNIKVGEKAIFDIPGRDDS